MALPTLKEHYQVPVDNDAAQSSHNQRLRGEFRKAGLIPKYDDYPVSRVEEIHNFDFKAREANDHMKVDLMCRAGNVSKRRAKNEIEEYTPF